MNNRYLASFDLSFSASPWLNILVASRVDLCERMTCVLPTGSRDHVRYAEGYHRVGALITNAHLAKQQSAIRLQSLEKRPCWPIQPIRLHRQTLQHHLRPGESRCY